MILFPLVDTRWRKRQLSSEKSALFPYIISVITTCCSIASCTSTQKLGYKLYQEARTHLELLVPKGENVQFKSRPTWFHHKSLGTQTKCEGIRKSKQTQSYVHIGKLIGRGLQTKEGNACAFLAMFVKSFYLHSAWHKSRYISTYMQKVGSKQWQMSWLKSFKKSIHISFSEWISKFHSYF